MCDKYPFLLSYKHVHVLHMTDSPSLSGFPLVAKNLHDNAVLPDVTDRVTRHAPMPTWRPSVAILFVVVPPGLCNLKVTYHLC